MTIPTDEPFRGALDARVDHQHRDPPIRSATARLPLAEQGQLQWPPLSARPTDPETSVSAALAETAGRSRLRAAVLDALRHRGGDGATDDELWQLFPGALLGSLAKRRHDLVQLGLIADSGRRRLTRRGCAAIVWVALVPGALPVEVPEPLPVLVGAAEVEAMAR
jgi:hypothetical protein